MKNILTLACGLLVAASAYCDFKGDVVAARYREYLFQTWQYQAGLAEQWMATLDEGGKWPDIDYEDQALANWKTARHLERVREMALAWKEPSSPLFGDGECRRKIDLALDRWLEKKYRNPNWWHNQIGVPRYMRDIVALLIEDLPQDRLKGALEVLAQFNIERAGIGANLIWAADLGLHYGAFTGDRRLMDVCREMILGEIKIHEGEGIQPDFSFHQHGKRLQAFQYGKAFLWETVRIAWQLRDTPLAFPAEKTKILTDFVLEGWQWMARGVNTVPGTMDRSATRVGELRSPDIRPLIPFLIELQPGQAEAFRKMNEMQNGNGALEGFRYFPYSDFAAYHRPGFSFFLKTISERTLPSESINGENLKGHLLNSGDAYLIRNGEEYFDLLPLWDWQALPGITSFDRAYRAERKRFVGSVSAHDAGLTAMDYALSTKEGDGALTARKMWACYGDAVVCLIANPEAEGAGEVFTALDQCRLQGDVAANKPGNILGEGRRRMEEVRWIHHNGFAYIPLKPERMNLHLTHKTGSWTSINLSEKTGEVESGIFMPQLIHRNGESTGYAAAYCETPKEARRLWRRPPWKALRNDKDCQAAMFSDGVLMAAFYAPSSVDLGKGGVVHVDQPCLLIMKDGKLFVSNPAWGEIEATITWNNRKFKVKMPGDGRTSEVEN